MGCAGDAEPKVIRLMMRIGVYGKHEIRHGTALGEKNSSDC